MKREQENKVAPYSDGRDFSAAARLTDGFVEARIVQAAVNLRVFDTLGKEGGTTREVSSRLGSDLRATGILLDALAALRLLDKTEDAYRLSPLAETFFLSSSPRSLGGMIRFDARLWELWGRLEETVRTGKPVRRTAMFQEDPEETALFMEAMDSLVRARGDADYLAGTLDFARFGTLLDVGAGPGTYLIAFCRAHPHLEGAIFDLPGTLSVTRRFLEREGMADRIRLIPGDYRRDPLPGGFDRIFLSNVIHEEDEDSNRRLMKKIHAALNPGGQVMIKDHILDETRTRPAAGALFSLQMLLTTDGRDYAFSEVREWLEEAGFREVSEAVLPSPMTSSLVTAVKP